MRFWDTSAVAPLLLREPATERVVSLLAGDPDMTIWWATPVECASAIARRRREGDLDQAGERDTLAALDTLSTGWSEIQATDAVRIRAQRLLALHPLRAADALQLASALEWCEDSPARREFVCLDNRLREAAYGEGFTLQPPLQDP